MGFRGELDQDTLQEIEYYIVRNGVRTLHRTFTDMTVEEYVNKMNYSISFGHQMNENNPSVDSEQVIYEVMERKEEKK